ncbi:Probable 26S proteasome regulatory subunit rpn7 [Taphrina deformans PYCC 5710]|uniref:Probable 26S proteasome regulatory subunit rpn7 n=1 Tax=Taphrina deformans (strain PYCC 5710 / ATCC 11124 / CBS 356.35 / IMI 108563 / JCM 9778 / NBRC 8474) TaxID=1097556 RepID=R4XGD3_TAPDE|nr:Probable 26S proteasome regulatory subunit rpn7 [Taphrina deformans PYCC 5710]|eukprot:CCG83549.1 Probable 26S proteasome regulatory subunit rpn7 [Taphrina deformans PYCC 5710]
MAAAVDENSLPAVPDLKLAAAIHQLQSPNLDHLHASAKEILQSSIDKDNLAPLYQYIHQELSLPHISAYDEKKYQDMKTINDQKLEEFDNRYKKCEEEEGDMELLTVLRERADYLALLCDNERAKEAYKTVFDKTATASKIDVLFGQLRLSLFFNENDKTASLLDECASLIEKGGDWDRRNRYKAYRGIYELSNRHFSAASAVLLDTISTFTSTELCSYASIVRYAIVSGLISLGRTDLKAKIVDAPEVLAMRSEMADLEGCVNCLYLSDYRGFFVALAGVQQVLLEDRYLAPHAHYYVRELRIKAYTQLLQSYSSLSITSMAGSFGVSVEWLDADLAKFIRQGRISAVIDRVGGIVESRKADGRSGMYESVIGEGDKLLNKLQKYQNALVV